MVLAVKNINLMLTGAILTAKIMKSETKAT
jgi:hypothetical protein